MGNRSHPRRQRFFIGSDFEKEAVARTPLRAALASPRNIATAAAFLASDDSFWINGAGRSHAPAASDCRQAAEGAKEREKKTQRPPRPIARSGLTLVTPCLSHNTSHRGDSSWAKHHRSGPPMRRSWTRTWLHPAGTPAGQPGRYPGNLRRQRPHSPRHRRLGSRWLPRHRTGALDRIGAECGELGSECDRYATRPQLHPPPRHREIRAPTCAPLSATQRNRPARRWAPWATATWAPWPGSPPRDARERRSRLLRGQISRFAQDSRTARSCSTSAARTSTSRPTRWRRSIKRIPKSIHAYDAGHGFNCDARAATAPKPPPRRGNARCASCWST